MRRRGRAIIIARACSTSITSRSTGPWANPTIDPFNPVETGSVKLGGMVRRQPYPARPDQPLNGAPQMVEISRDGRRLYVTNSLYRTWDDQFYPDGVKGWLAKVDVIPNGGIELDTAGFVEFDSMRPHQVHLEGGDASSDSYCFA